VNLDHAVVRYVIDDTHEVSFHAPTFRAALGDLKAAKKRTDVRKKANELIENPATRAGLKKAPPRA